MSFIVRARLFHTPSNPFETADALEWFDDGALVVREGRIAAAGALADVKQQYPDLPVHDHRPALLMPGFVDAHVHFSQLHMIGAMGKPLLQWLQEHILPEEARFADEKYARRVAKRFLRALARNGTTSALVFGSHLASAQDVFFAEAAASGLRIASGLALGDRELLPALHTTPQRAYDESLALARRWHGQAGGKLRYAVTPRFALSASDALLEVCSALQAEIAGSLFTTHINETPDEIAAVRQLFPWAGDYLDVYQRYGLVRPGAVYAHNLHPCDRELDALAAGQAAVAHCPCSNAFLGSGLFSMRRHVARGVRVALGSDVGAGTGFGILNEALMAYKAQMLQPDGYRLTPAHLLYLATKAGAEALGLGTETGDLSPGKAADFVVLEPPADSTLAAVLSRADGPEHVLGAVFALAGEDSVKQVYVDGRCVYDRTVPPEADLEL